ncbi:hypothetical protein MVEN_01965200 [Mycena venus]|uniref:Glycan binding protein Y3-like domain-containing protein n=1 Tax=Mycena venus TaxID=2733690 RepID=A0A8H7CK28_9AGAR|nr:hypothetical protein MVEN_01965200 [Mycena venus]
MPCLAQLEITCFVGGPSGDCVEFAPTFCSSLASLSISAGDTVAHCFNFNGAAAGSSCQFTAVNTLTSSAVPNAINCESALFTVADECPSGGGGQSSGSNFKFWMDPNAVACGSPNGI